MEILFDLHEESQPRLRQPSDLGIYKRLRDCRLSWYHRTIFFLDILNTSINTRIANLKCPISVEHRDRRR